MYMYMLPKYPPPTYYWLKKNQSKFIISLSQLVISQEYGAIYFDISFFFPLLEDKRYSAFFFCVDK